MTEWNVEVPCDACGAESGEPCRPLCIGVPEDLIAPAGTWYAAHDEDASPWRDR